jgi:predicted TIM-barrel fold metal-dependent hydrolase
MRSGGNQSAAAMLRDYERRAVFATQLDTRLAAQEEDGFVGEVIFPDASSGNEIPFAVGFGGVGDYATELHHAALRAYNRWLGETADPDRQLGLAQIPLRDPEYAAKEVRKARALGLRGVMLQWDGFDPTNLPMYHERFDPMWAACADDDLPVNFHSGSGLPDRGYDRSTPPAKIIHATESMFWCRRPLWHLIFGGVLERHPKLRVGFVETFADWIPRSLKSLDWMWTTRADDALREICPLSPSEYWARQCFTGAHAASLVEQQMRNEFPPGTFTYGTDFPHPGSPWGNSREFLQATMGVAGVTEAEARAILGETCCRIYGVDVAKLAPIVERVGPTPEDILTVPEGVDLTAGMAPFIRSKVYRPASHL